MVDVNLGSLEFTLLDSRLGTIVLVTRNKRLIALDITREDGAVTRKRLREEYPGVTESVKPFGKIQRLLDQFLRGVKVDFDVPFDLGDMGDFSRRVLLEVKAIPYGTVVSYGSIGKRLGYPMAARAVGQAVGRNPIPIVIPCHRVVRSDGRLGGFGLGINVKEHLLAMEGVHLPQ
jgi:methylated-DNA-[protein]-cysteine S-methyltransferase